MTPEEKRKLDLVVAQTDENNRILKRMQRNARIGGFFRMIYYLVIIGVTLGSYFYIQPYLDQALKVLRDPKQSASGLFDQNFSKQIQAEFQKFMDSQKAQ